MKALFDYSKIQIQIIKDCFKGNTDKYRITYYRDNTDVGIIVEGKLIILIPEELYLLNDKCDILNFNCDPLFNAFDKQEPLKLTDIIRTFNGDKYNVLEKVNAPDESIYVSSDLLKYFPNTWVKYFGTNGKSAVYVSDLDNNLKGVIMPTYINK